MITKTQDKLVDVQLGTCVNCSPVRLTGEDRINYKTLEDHLHLLLQFSNFTGPNNLDLKRSKNTSKMWSEMLCIQLDLALRKNAFAAVWTLALERNLFRRRETFILPGTSLPKLTDRPPGFVQRWLVLSYWYYLQSWAPSQHPQNVSLSTSDLPVKPSSPLQYVQMLVFICVWKRSTVHSRLLEPPQHKQTRTVLTLCYTQELYLKQQNYATGKSFITIIYYRLQDYIRHQFLEIDWKIRYHACIQLFYPT